MTLPTMPERSCPQPGRCACPQHPAEGITRSHETDAARLAALLPADLLQPGEIIILLLKPSPWFILLAPLGSLAAIGAFTAVVAAVNQLLPGGPRQHDLVLLGVGAIGLRLFWQFLEWLGQVYVLTDQRVIRVEGVLRVSVFEARLEQIQHTELVFPLRQRIFGLGTVAFSTAGTAFREAYWHMIAYPIEVHQIITRTIHRYRR
ncbi:MAG: PH domain-containing protein [Phycisphaeraceae bacterium]